MYANNNRIVVIANTGYHAIETKVAMISPYKFMRLINFDKSKILKEIKQKCNSFIYKLLHYIKLYI